MGKLKEREKERNRNGELHMYAPRWVTGRGMTRVLLVSRVVWDGAGKGSVEMEYSYVYYLSHTS